MRGILILSHGQAQVERGFSVNKETMCINMIERTLIAKRLIYDSIKAIGGFTNLLISSNMRMAAASARSKYRIYPIERAEEEKRKNLKRKRDNQLEELEAMKAKKARFERDVTSLTDCRQAGRKGREHK
ncbi:mediator of RNA polymerase II transcription subunit 2 [Biomphalaria glabrata]|nr:mediator of RNA polymerase II transcription subunit 2 [Biomphalaria glabrata]